MSERASKQGVHFKVAVFTIIATIGLPIVPALLFGGELPFDGIYFFVAYIAVYIALFTVFLRVSGTLLFSLRELAIAYLLGCGILGAVYFIHTSRGDELLLSVVMVPIVISGSYLACCALTKRL